MWWIYGNVTAKACSIQIIVINLHSYTFVKSPFVSANVPIRVTCGPTDSVDNLNNLENYTWKQPVDAISSEKANVGIVAGLWIHDIGMIRPIDSQLIDEVLS